MVHSTKIDMGGKPALYVKPLFQGPCSWDWLLCHKFVKYFVVFSVNTFCHPAFQYGFKNLEKFPTQDQNAKSAAFSLIHLYIRVNEQVWYTIFKCHWVLYILKVWFSIFNRDISCRTFSTAKFISDHKNNLTPAGLCFFQATWDESVTQTYMEKLGMVSL